jgi:hypothetical protein
VPADVDRGIGGRCRSDEERETDHGHGPTAHRSPPAGR